MNHDYAHCADFKDDCPKKCFRAKLVRDLQKYGKLAPYGINYPISWMHFKGTEECKKKEVTAMTIVGYRAMVNGATGIICGILAVEPEN